MTIAGFFALLAISLQLWFVKAAVELTVNVTAFTTEVESDWTAVYYSNDKPLLLGNDGGPDRGGFHVYDLDSNSPLNEVESVVVGRTKIVTTVYGVGGRDVAVTIAQPDSVIRLYEMPGFTPINGSEFQKLGDWSALCHWRSGSGNQYLFLFGKGQAVQFLVQHRSEQIEVVEIQTFQVPFEATGCATSHSASRMFLSMDDSDQVYALTLQESTSAPELTEVGVAQDAVTGLAVYVSKSAAGDYLFVASEDSIAVYDASFAHLGTMELSGLEDVEIQGLNIYQAATSKYPAGVVSYAIESDKVNGFGITSLDGVLEEFGGVPYTGFDPRHRNGCRPKSPTCDACSHGGYCLNDGAALGASKCDCFAGYSGAQCKSYTCIDDCSGHGECIGPNMCQCTDGWGGLHCSFLLVEPSFETEANGGDGDDPAIWISPASASQSRIITTTKSEEGAGLAVFDLSGKLLQTFAAGEPNNVDIIYGFQAGNRTIDLAFAACREDDTLCLFEMKPDGTLADVPGGTHPVVDDFTVYGSCTYRSPKSGKQYLFVNEKSARYLQYELTAAADGKLETTLVREFQGGSGGQVEGCVADEENGWLILGEEPSALWRYEAEPDAGDESVLIAKVGDGHLYGDVEGVTLVLGSTSDDGFIIVSCQGVSAYNVYLRASPHEYVTTFTIVKSSDGMVDAVSNTDGVTAVATALGKDFPHGLIVVHDDSNQLPNGSTSAEASFKLVSLENVLGAAPLRDLGLLSQVDPEWDPRK